MPINPLVLCCPSGITESPPEEFQSLLWGFFSSAKCKSTKTKSPIKTVQCRCWSDRTPESGAETYWVSWEPPSLLHSTTSSLPLLSSAFSSSDAKTVVSWEGKVWNDLPFPWLLARPLSRISFQHYQIELLWSLQLFSSCPVSFPPWE